MSNQARQSRDELELKLLGASQSLLQVCGASPLVKRAVTRKVTELEAWLKSTFFKFLNFRAYTPPPSPAYIFHGMNSIIQSLTNQPTNLTSKLITY